MSKNYKKDDFNSPDAEDIHTEALEQVTIDLTRNDDREDIGLISGQTETRASNTINKIETFSKKNALFAVLFYWITSLSLVFLNKIVMVGDVTHMDAPLFMSWSQFFITVICCYILGFLGKRIKIFSFFPEFEYKLDVAKKVLPLTFVFLGMIVFNNLCLKFVEVSFYQVARSLTLVFNLIFSFILLGKRQSYIVLLICGIIVFGYYLGCEGEVHFSIIGVIYGVLSSIFVALYSIYVKKTLSIVDDNSEKLMIYNNINASLILPFIIILFTDEWLEIRVSSFVFMDIHFWMITIIAGICGFLINFASFLQIKHTSPLSHNVSGTAKAAVQTLIALWIFRNPTTPTGLLGVAIVIVGSFVYSRAK